MSKDELKLRINKFVTGIIDAVFPRIDLISNMENAVIKFYVDQNMYKLDSYLDPFVDQYGSIDTERFLNILREQVLTNDVFQLDIAPYVPEVYRSYIPSPINIQKEDVVRILHV